MIYLPISPDVCKVVDAAELFQITPADLQAYPGFGRIDDVRLSGKCWCSTGRLLRCLHKYVIRAIMPIREIPRRTLIST